ncbi:HEAT repeat domain-containing protein [Cyanobium sp. CH-040]|uniref:HEAT repeat domain-containing protein n=1 Tax=Cyanobium sp. CH-040 TaxID=2823708 RepID=UPI0020CF1E4F|nr:HEAT repeat domain-containing protein [Cyanobium sp. CH-040]MCP9929040.1 HEAT repeat domain-containing protein [Cyanobium sp. CH-040]
MGERSAAVGHPVDLEALVAAVRSADSSAALVSAARSLAASGEPAAAPVLVEVLGFNNPGAAVAAVDGLIRLQGAAVEPLLRLDPQNYGARAWAVRALAGIGDVRGLTLLVDALGSDVAASVRRAAAKGLGGLRLQHLEPSQRLDIQACCLEALLAATDDGEWVVRYAVAVALESLARGLDGGGESLQQPLLQGLRSLSAAAAGNPPVVQLRARLALAGLDPCAVEP